MKRQLNRPNWFQAVTVYAPGSSTPVAEFSIDQVWDGSLKGHRRLRRQAFETVEALRDRDGLEYYLWSPLMYGGVTVPWADKQTIVVS